MCLQDIHYISTISKWGRNTVLRKLADFGYTNITHDSINTHFGYVILNHQDKPFKVTDEVSMHHTGAYRVANFLKAVDNPYVYEELF